MLWVKRHLKGQPWHPQLGQACLKPNLWLCKIFIFFSRTGDVSANKKSPTIVRTSVSPPPPMHPPQIGPWAPGSKRKFDPEIFIIFWLWKLPPLIMASSIIGFFSVQFGPVFGRNGWGGGLVFSILCHEFENIANKKTNFVNRVGWKYLLCVGPELHLGWNKMMAVLHPLTRNGFRRSCEETRHAGKNSEGISSEFYPISLLTSTPLRSRNGPLWTRFPNSSPKRTSL